MRHETAFAIGAQLKAMREDVGISQARLAAAADLSGSHVSRIEAALTEPSIETLTALAAALGGRLVVRIEPGAGSPVRDHIQAQMMDELMRRLHPRWSRFLEVPVHRPVRGVIDAVLGDSGVLVAAELHSQIHRLEPQIRWANEKADALRSTDVWRAVHEIDPETNVSRLLVLRSTRSTREVARRHGDSLGAAYPARTDDVVDALAGDGAWPGAGIVWMDVSGGRARLLDLPPRGVAVGRGPTRATVV